MFDIPIAVWIKGSRPTEKEQEFINQLGPSAVLNAKFFRATNSDRISATKVYNLSGNKAIDEFYADNLITGKVVIDAEFVNDSSEGLQAEGQEEKQVDDSPKKRGRPPLKKVEDESDE